VAAWSSIIIGKNDEGTLLYNSGMSGKTEEKKKSSDQAKV
jgi:hypothetical protein